MTDLGSFAIVRSQKAHGELAGCARISLRQRLQRVLRSRRRCKHQPKHRGCEGPPDHPGTMAEALLRLPHRRWLTAAMARGRQSRTNNALTPYLRSIVANNQELEFPRCRD